MKVASLFEPGLVDRLALQYEQVDVHAIAGQVIDMAKRKVVRNASGLLVSLVRKAAKSKPLTIGTADPRELQRYATFHAELYRRVAIEQLGPGDVARIITNARSNGYPRLNEFVADSVRALGVAWPTSPLEAPSC